MATNPTQNIHQLVFRSMLEREKLYGPNFNEWYRQLRIVLRVEKRTDVLDVQMAAAPDAATAPDVATGTVAQLEAFNAQYDRHNEVACLMLGKLVA